MTFNLGIVLIVVSILTVFYISKKIKKSQMNINDTMFWVIFALMLIVMSVFPELPSWGSRLLGFQAPVNFVFIIVIFMLLLRTFLLSIKVSQIEDKLRTLTEEVAIRENMKSKNNIDNTDNKDNKKEE